jgi:class 3 adenylate cyclase
LFPNATVMFADISGFTAWSSVREPALVFTLFETIYSCFDKVAKKRKVDFAAVSVLFLLLFSLGYHI